MNLLFLTQEYPPETGWGGVGTQKYSIARALARMGHQVHVLTAAVPPSPTYEYAQDGVHVHRVRRWKFEVPLVRRLWVNTLPWTKHQWEYMITVRTELSRLVTQYAIDCIEGAEIWGEGLLYSFARHAPIVVKLSGPFFLIRKLNSGGLNLDWTLVDRADEMWTKRADQITSSSHSLAHVVSEKYRIPLTNIRVVSNPVDTERFFPTPEKIPSTPTILYSGRIEPRKGILTLVQAIPDVVRAYPEARFVLVGADSSGLRAQLQNNLERAGVARNVEFVGHVAYDEIPRHYQASTVCVFPSLYEPFGNVCLEAMACAKPVVATDAGGFAEIVIPGETGLLVPPNDSDALARAIQTVLANPTQARVWGENARRRAESEYASAVIAKRSLAVYAETAARWKRTHHAA
jgi:glycosyltransferase involved in cell wall biosynthesis